MLEMERTTKDGLFTLIIKFNEESIHEYPADAIREMVKVLDETSASLKFALEHPEFGSAALGGSAS